MTARTNTPLVEPEDVDLMLLIERLIRYFRKYIWAYVIALIVGTALGLYFYSVLPIVYRSRMVVHSYILTNQEDIQIVGNWRNLLKKKEYIALATALNCPPALIRQVKDIKADEIQKVYTPANPNGFIIEVTVTNNDILPSLQSAIVYAFENNEYVKERLEAKKTGLRELIDKTNTELRKLDSTKNLIERIVAGKGNASSSLIINNATINNELINMNEKLLNYKESLRFTNAVQVLQSFSKFSKPSGPKLIVWLLVGLTFCLCLAFTFTLFHSVAKKLKERARLKAL